MKLSAIPYHEVLVATLARQYRLTTAEDRSIGASWYPSARAYMQRLAMATDYTVETCSCVTAALSPQIDWPSNLQYARYLLTGRATRKGCTGPLNANIAKAVRLRDMHARVEDMFDVFPSGPKVNCFAANLAGDERIVTIDSHAAQCACDSVTIDTRLKWEQYQRFALAYLDAALRADVLPTTFQATLWVSWKRRYPRAEKKRIQRLERI